MLNLNLSRIMIPWKLSSPTITTNSSNRRRRRTAFRPTPLAAASYSNSTNNINNINSSSEWKRTDTENLRTQLDQLHAEAEATRSKANSARLRLMRLSEAAENLQKRAARSVLASKEIEARELLVQKKRLMQALEKSKNRIDVLDKLAMKINEAISLKEEQLIGNVAMYPEMSQEESGHQIRFVNPKVYNEGESNETNGLDKDCIKTGHDDVQETENYEESLHLDFEELNIKENSSIDTSHHENLAGKLNGISSYEDFLQYVDGQLQKVESDLVMFLKLSTLMLENKEKQTSSKVKQTSGLLKDIRSIRARVASIIKGRLDDKTI